MYKLFGTLIKDNIPEKIKKDGDICNYAVVQNDELYQAFLKDRLIEAVNAYLQMPSTETLCEILLVVNTIGSFDREAFDATYAAQLKDNGGYDKKYVYLQIPREMPAPTEGDTQTSAEKATEQVESAE